MNWEMKTHKATTPDNDYEDTSAVMDMKHAVSGHAPRLHGDERHSESAGSALASNPAGVAVRRMLNRSGNSLISAIEPLSDAEFFEAAASGISVAWTVGHLACVFDLFTSWIRGGNPNLPREVHGTFNNLDLRAPGESASKADVVRGSGYGKSDIQFMLRTTQIQGLKLLDTCTVSGWDAAPRGRHPDNLRTVGEIWEHLAVHTYWHMGELCGTFPRFHGTYTLNMLPHYFFYMPTENDCA